MPRASHEYDVILYKGYEHLKVWASTGILTNECAWVRDSMLGSHRFQCFFFFFLINNPVEVHLHLLSPETGFQILL